MTLYPAIDILEGSAVRLVKGDFEAKKVYDEDPLDAARGWTEAGANTCTWSISTAPSRARRSTSGTCAGSRASWACPCSTAAGCARRAAVGDALAAGATRVILGTAAFTQAGLLEQVLGEHGEEHVLVSVDVRGGHVTTAGWTETTEITTAAVIESLAERGARNLVFTNVDRDGMLEGPDLEEVRGVLRAAREGSVIYSGGIGQLADLEGLAGLGEPSLEGVIVGKALYERRFTVAQALAVV